MKKTLAFLLNVYVDTLDTDTTIMPAATLCNALASEFDVKIVVHEKIACKFAKHLRKEVKISAFDYNKFFTTPYILDIKKIDLFAKNTFNTDYVVAFAMNMSAASLVETVRPSFQSNSALHLRMVSILKSAFSLIMPAKAFLYAKEKAVFRIFDYWNVVDFKRLIGKDITWLGLYDDPHFSNPKTKAKAAIKYCPDIDYLKFIKEDVKTPSKKTRLFTFGYNIGSYRPLSMSDFLADYLYDDPSSKIFVYRKYDRNGVKYNNLIPMKKYYAAIALSKYTLVIPSTLTSEVSVLRVNESIRRKCIPLFTSDNNIGKVYSQKTCEFIKQNLMFDKAKHKDLNEWIKQLDSKYDSLLEEVESLDFVKAGYALTEKDILEAIENA